MDTSQSFALGELCIKYLHKAEKKGFDQINTFRLPTEAERGIFSSWRIRVYLSWGGPYTKMIEVVSLLTCQVEVITLIKHYILWRLNHMSQMVTIYTTWQVKCFRMDRFVI
jgi:hypothetical protein